MKDIKQELVDEAMRLVCGERRDAYGDPHDNFGRIALMWTAIINRAGVVLSPSDVALMMIALKLSRLANKGASRDSVIDIIGYATLYGELERVGMRPIDRALHDVQKAMGEKS